MHAQTTPTSSRSSPAPAAPQQHANRLAGESSPYLLQHAHNPVDWFPWGPEAFAEARRRGVPIFLSVGYSTCYWCHVMERESFENEQIAALMNERFVCIKVDREERPDVDDIYMAAVQLITRRGGWPMSVWLLPPGASGDGDPGLQPFYAGTYFPAEPRAGMASFPDVLTALSNAWTTQREQVIDQGRRVTDAIREQIAQRQPPTAIGRNQVLDGMTALLELYDRQNAGFGRAPKFPQPVYLEYLLQLTPTINDPAVAGVARRAIRHTLDRMATGGMYDQVGGGFHRYSVDDKWLVPHFEKMLYDNGQLASIYARSFALWRDAFDAEVLRETLDYVLREMTDPLGGFYSAQDAEVNHREGQNYLWTPAQLQAALNGSDADFASRVYGLTDGPNFRDPHHPDDPAANVLFLSDRPEKVAAALGIDAEQFRSRLARINETLYKARATRDQPGLDDKVLAGWNGLMIAGMAEGAAALGERKYLDAAEKSANFILTTMRDDKGRLLRVWRRGVARTPAVLEDYAMLAHGLLAIHRARVAMDLPPGDQLAQSATLVDLADSLFGETEGEHPGAMYDTLPGQSELIVRAFSTYDGAIPAGASVMCHDLLDLFELTGDRRWIERAALLIGALSHAIKEAPVASINATRALDRLLRLEPALVQAIGAQDAAEEAPVVVRDAPAKIFAAAERITVGPGAPASLPIEIRIDDGFHITAHDPGIEGLVPFEVRIEGGTGVNAVVKYPAGAPYEGAAVPPEDRGRMRVYTGTVRFVISLERTDDPWTGIPLVIITYQPCTDDACFQPITVELDVAIDPG
jgi:uncharacterized protein YyaL (SSP411 family)